MHVIPASPRISSVTSRDGSANAVRFFDIADLDVIVVADGSPPHAALERALAAGRLEPTGSARCTRLLDWEPLLTDAPAWDADHRVIVIAVLLTCGMTQRWRTHPHFPDVMRRAILVAPLPHDAGTAIVAACGLGGFVALDRIESELGAAVRELSAHLRVWPRRDPRAPIRP